ncbi:MAG: ATP-binding protein [Cellvibrionaceae bacterium]
MTKIYLKIFIGFWLINIVTILLHNIWEHWFDLGPANELVQYDDNPYDQFAIRGLNATINSTINWELDAIRTGIGNAPEYIFRRVFIIDPDGKDLRNREIPVKVQEILSHLSPAIPFYKTSEEEQTYAGRYIILPDGSPIRIVSFSTPAYGRRVLWQLYVIRNWQFFLISILISGTVCFVFARHMSRDFRALRKATNDIAKGDLSVRLGPKLGNRKDEIAELGHDLDNMAVRLEKSMLEQKRLIKDVSHELRSPLARIQVALGIAQQKTSSPDVAEQLDKVSSAADYLNDIITTILSFPTTEADTWELSDVIDIKMLVESLCNDFIDEAKQKHVEIDFHSETIEVLVATYGNTLIGVFENILRNALHYTSSHSKISVSICKSPNHCSITIADEGPGVPEKELTDIFEPFYRTDQARDRASGGYGLGLSIAQRTIALHNGTITASNRTDKTGLSMTVTLPYQDFGGDEY